MTKFFNSTWMSEDRVDEICSSIGLRIDEVCELKDSSGNIVPPEVNQKEQLFRKYRDSCVVKVKRECERIPLASIASRGRYALTEEIYIDLTLRRYETYIRDWHQSQEKLVEKHTKQSFPRLSYREPKHKSLKEVNALTNYRHLLIYGSPGAGKTTLLKWAALQCARGNIFPDKIPTYASCDAFTSQELGLLDWLHERFFEGLTNLHYKGFLNSGKIVLFFDDLGGINSIKRKRAEREVCDFTDKYPKCNCIVTSRPSIRYQKLEGFDQVHISTLTDKSIERYVKGRFHNFTDSELANRFLQELRHRPQLLELAGVPLFLSMLCLIFVDDERLPDNRIGLYKYGLAKLIKEIETPNVIYPGVRESDTPLRMAQAEIFLREIAADFFLSEQTLFSQDGLIDEINNYFSKEYSIKKSLINSREILDAITINSNLIVSRSANYYSFSHLTFQEYLAAQHFVHENKWNLALDHLYEPRYQFILLMIAELIREPQIEYFFINFKNRIDSSVVNNQRFVDFFRWLDSISGLESTDVHSSHGFKKTLLRACYFAYSLGESEGLGGLTHVRTRSILPDYYSATSLTGGRQLALHKFLYSLLFYLSQDKADEERQTSTLTEEQIQAAQPFDPSRRWEASFLKTMDRLSIAIQNYAPDERRAVESWQANIKAQRTNTGSDWWRAYRLEWRNTVIKYMNRIGVRVDWEFTPSEKTELQNYYMATYLLSLCFERRSSKRNKLIEALPEDLLNPIRDNQYLPLDSQDPFTGFGEGLIL